MQILQVLMSLVLFSIYNQLQVHPNARSTNLSSFPLLDESKTIHSSIAPWLGPIYARAQKHYPLISFSTIPSFGPSPENTTPTRHGAGTRNQNKKILGVVVPLCVPINFRHPPADRVQLDDILQVRPPPRTARRKAGGNLLSLDLRTVLSEQSTRSNRSAKSKRKI